MPYRGRLIFPMHVRISRMNPNAMTSAGFDDDFREPVRVSNGTQAGESARLEMEPVDIPAQIEDQDWKSLQMEPSGNDPSTTVVLVFHMRDLERLGYVDSETGNVLCPMIGDRLDAIIDPRSGRIEQKAPDPGIYCIQAAPRSYGLGALRRNLLVCTFAERGKARR